jgi:hypothetical protein
MKKLFVLLLFALAFSSSIARAAMSPSMVGVGPHGYDFMIGSWSCKNSVPSTLGGPAATTVTVARAANGSLSVHVSGTNFGAMGYVAYEPKTKTWWNPSVLATGDYSTESTQQTGKKTVWAGPFFDAASGKTMMIRDTYTMGPASFTDLSEAQIGDTWKTEGNTTCTKT